ncbi:uncharacterized protein JCM10292_001582 [Rhodotorula paludigena]|uniref:uncharacterized protein n=1 Tax=Rhodotorula paludigena TaxID=86838 RepID=UPI003180A562
MRPRAPAASVYPSPAMEAAQLAPPAKRRRTSHEHAAAAQPPLPVSTAPPSPASPPLASVSSLAQFAAEMVAWLWFAPPEPDAANSEPAGTAGPGRRGESPAISKLQVRPSDRFLRFCQEVLSTTQVSHSVVLLALLFISRLKQRNPINGAPGSEYRLAVTGLMLANKVLDDNTYTAQTWSQVSSLELKPLVAGEAEFLRGLDWSLHVTKRDFEAWRKLLEGHVTARKARLGRASVSGGPSRRYAPSKRARDSVVEADLRGLGIGFEGEVPAPSSLRVPSYGDADAAVEGGRQVRRRLDAPASTTATPISSFASYTMAPSSAPHPLNSAPLPQYPQLGSTPTTDAPRKSLEVSPTALAFHKRNSGFRASAPHMHGSKRSAEDAFAASEPFVAPAIPAHIHPQVQQPAYMTRSYSASAAALTGSVAQSYTPQAAASTPPPPLYLHPAHGVTPIPFAQSSSPLHSRPSSSSSAVSGIPPPPFLPYPFQAHFSAPTGFQALTDAFSPRYDSEQHRRMQQGNLSLGYYSLAAGQGLGHLRQTLPPPLMAGPYPAPYGAVPHHLPPPAYHNAYTASTLPYAPHYPSSLSASTSPLSGPTAWESHSAYPTPTPPLSVPQYGGTPMVPSASAQGSLAHSGSRRTSGGQQQSRPASSPTGLSCTGTGGARSAAVPPLYSPFAPPPIQPQHRAYGSYPHLPHAPPPQHSSFANAGAPGVWWQG